MDVVATVGPGRMSWNLRDAAPQCERRLGYTMSRRESKWGQRFVSFNRCLQVCGGGMLVVGSFDRSES